MTLHSSISNFEIIGWLGGFILGNQIIIKKAYSVEEVRTQTPTMNVEMDPISAIEIQSVIEGDGFSVIGWYHSHPKFKTNPSNIDIENQLSMQLGMSGDFIAGIINPCYRDEIELSFFNVKEEEHEGQDVHVPHSFDYEIEGDTDFNMEKLNAQCKSLIQNYANKKGKINPARKLKQNVTGIQRLERNLAEVFPQSEIVAEMVEEVVKLYKKA